jgi:putative transcriptional regulator
MLLLATPALLDPNFADTVILVLDAGSEGALGVVLNRPTALPVGEVLGVWGDVVAEPEVLFQGGPVETDGAIAVALRRTDPAAEAEVLGLREVVDRLALLDLDTPVELVSDELDALRIFAGYSGWGAGQLEREIEEGSWYVVPGTADDVFRVDTSTLRRDVLRRQPGDLAWHSTRPLDPEVN